MSLLSYWPTKEEVDRCIKSEAESVSDEVLLAVHQEFPLSYSKVGPDGRVVADSSQPASEDDLLRHFLGSAPEGSLVVPITGASGVGKSHLIRILDARLRRLPDASRYLIIRIPKSASLRRVVELILEAEPLQGPNYDSIRVEFEKALIDVPLEQQVILFQAQLEISLRDHAKELAQQLNQSFINDPTLQPRLGIARQLPHLLTDATTTEYFRNEVLPRIIHGSVEGLVESSQSVDPTDCQFKASDFDFPDNVDISKAATAVHRFYQLVLSTSAGQGKAIAANVLNQVVDRAMGELYKLNQSLGGKTLGEVIDDIRSLLYAEDPNKELIILVEDFKVLVGIQDTLAKILIQHGETDGKKTHATIRSAIAVTDGYLAGRDTLATRAGREWVVESRLEAEAEVLLRTKRLVTSYLNAARHGEAKLKTIYNQTQVDSPTTDHRWVVPIYSEGGDEHETILSAFGKVQDIPLFPFTEYAIECLARSTLTSANALVFNPRFVIRNVIRDVLLAGRHAYVNKQFPPPEINGKPLASDIAQWLALQSYSTDLKKRFERLISIWGNQPVTQTDISRIPAPVFEAFGLPLPEITSQPPQTVRLPAPHTSDKPPEVIPSIGDEKSKKVQDFQAALERWVQNGTLLEQPIANAVRKSISTLLNRRIDWNAECCIKRDIKPTQFSLPNSGGEKGLEADPVNVAESTDDPDGRLRGDILALLRYVEVYNEVADYESADEDLARIGNLIDRLRPKVLVRVRTVVKQQAKSAMTLLATNSRLLGLIEKGRTPAALSSFLFGDVKPLNDVKDTAPQAFKDWRLMQQDALKIRADLIQRVLESSGCFQGTGVTAYGVDIVGLLECYENDNITADLAVQNISPDLRQTLMTMRASAVSARLNQVLDVAKKIQVLIVNELNAEFDKHAVIDTVKAVATNLKEMGAWPATLGFSSKAFFDICESFRNSAVKESLSALADVLTENAESPSNALKKISRVAQMPLEPLLTAQRFISDARIVIRAATDHALTLEKQYEGLSPVQKADELTETFVSLVADLSRLQ